MSKLYTALHICFGVVLGYCYSPKSKHDIQNIAEWGCYQGVFLSAAAVLSDKDKAQIYENAEGSCPKIALKFKEWIESGTKK